MHVVIIGSGLAGLAAALSLPADTRVTIVSKSALGHGNSAWAQGGIAAALGSDDSAELHARDTVAAGAGLSDAAAVRFLTEQGPKAIEALQRWGVRFDGSASGHPVLGREAAHSVNRIVHAGGDATGANIMAALVARVRERAAQSWAVQGRPMQNVSGAAPFVVLEQTAVSRLRVHDGRVSGVETVSRDGQHSVIDAHAAVLATGGAGQLFSHTSNPAGATGDGIALALEAGARVADLEFVQFHPTTLSGADGFLVSEAVRGEGAVLVDELGHRFMPDFHPLAELAPRDVVASAISDVMQGQDGRPVLLDATALGAERLAQRFPTIDAATRAAGYDWSTHSIPVTPAAHYMMGGVVTDRCGRSSLPGLWAVGEVARTGVHGANRLASNSLVEALVFARAAADDIVSGNRPGISIVADLAQDAATSSTAGAPGPLRAPTLTRHELQQLMWQHAGLSRNSAGLARAEATLTAATMAHSADTGEVADPVQLLEDRALRTVALAVVRAAAARPESIGAHRRSDEILIRKQSA